MTDHILATRNRSGRQATQRYVQNLQATHTPPSVRSELLAAAKDAILTLRLGPSAGALLGLLVSCISTDRVVNVLMVWPSNAWLQARSGQSERTIQRGVLRLCAEGLIEVARSANGKRFARRDRFGTISQAFGFSLLPLLSCRQDLAARAVRKREDEEARQMARRQIAAEGEPFRNSSGALGATTIKSSPRRCTRPSTPSPPLGQLRCRCRHSCAWPTRWQTSWPWLERALRCPTI